MTDYRSDEVQDLGRPLAETRKGFGTAMSGVIEVLLDRHLPPGSFEKSQGLD